MRRRDLLAGTTGAVCGLAGCTGSTFERLQSERPADDESADSSGGGDQDAAGAQSDEPIVVGDPDEVPFPAAHPPHQLELGNEGETDRTVSVEITTDEGSGSTDSDGDNGNAERDADDALLERDLDIAAGETLELVLVEPRSYTVTVTTSSDGGASQSTVTDGVDRRPFDCTRSQTSIALSGSGVQTESTSASIPCPALEVTDSSLEVGEGECAGRTDGDGATVAFTDEAVIVDGEIGTPTPCHGLSLADAAYDEGSDVLTVTVAVGDQDAENCVDCLGVVDYEARIDLAGRYPGRVDVYHRSRGEEQQVTVAEYSAN